MILLPVIAEDQTQWPRQTLPILCPYFPVDDVNDIRTAGMKATMLIFFIIASSILS